jgi:hypothetical protein
MSDIEFRERAPRLRDAGPLTNDFRPPRLRASDREVPTGPAVPTSPAMYEIEAPNDPRADMLSTGATVNLRKLEERLTRNPLDEVATLIHGLTYGEMIELAEAMWKSQPDGPAITQDTLPGLLYRWSKSRVIADGVGFP